MWWRGMQPRGGLRLMERYRAEQSLGRSQARRQPVLVDTRLPALVSALRRSLTAAHVMRRRLSMAMSCARLAWPARTAARI